MPAAHPSPTPVFTRLGCLGLVLGLALVAPGRAFAAEPKVAESFALEIVGLPLEHQGPQVIDLNFRMTYVEGIAQKDIPDFEVIHREIKEFLTTYPNEKDYIEVVNKKLCLDVLKRYPVLGAVSVDIRIYPTMTVPYVQTSHCTASR